MLQAAFPSEGIQKGKRNEREKGESPAFDFSKRKENGEISLV